MAVVTYDALMNSLKSGEYAPLYLLQGDESYFIDRIVDYIAENALSESEKVFNQLICYGKDSNSRTIMDNARQYPMMAQRRVIILKEAQTMRDIKELASYVAHPAESTVLVLAHPHKKLDGRSALAKAIARNGVIYEAKTLYDNKLPAWIESYMASKKYKIEPEASAAMAEYLGSDLTKTVNEIDKLIITLGDRTTVTRDDVFKNIGVSKDYNVFELQKALGRRDPIAIQRIMLHFMGNMKANPLVMIIGSLYSYFSKILIVRAMGRSSDNELAAAIQLRNTFFLREYKSAAQKFSTANLEYVIALLRKYDLQSKGMGARSKPDHEVLREIVQEIYTLPARNR
jgi:DNA polymerase III subunit delta